MIHDYWRRLWAVHVILCVTGGAHGVQGARGFQKKVSMLLHEEPENPKCFAEGRKDLTCFWEEDERAGSVDQYSFIYTYQNERSSKCPLKSLHLTSGRKLYVCHLNQTQMFVQMDIQVNREGRPVHNRSLLIELTFLLDPPANVTVRNAAQSGQVNVSWIPPPLKYMDDSMMYEIIYTPVDSHIGQVEVARASSELVLRGLQPATKYKVQVRVKLDGISYSGYWSAWSDPVFIDTPPADLDPLIISLSVIISFGFLVLSLSMLVSHRRYLMKKVWPTIPTPENKFQGLFTIYGGDFQEWLGHTSGDLWQNSNLFYSEECPSPLEVLSELPVNPLLQCPPLPPKGHRVVQDVKTQVDTQLQREDSTQTEDWTRKSHDHWLMERLQALQQHPVPYSQESQDTYVTLSHNNNSEDGQDGVPVENVPLEVLFTSKKESESHSDLGSGSGQLSSQSSFEYSNQDWAHKPPYTYMAVADSGVSMDYSPMNTLEDTGKVPVLTHEYKNDISLRRPFLTRQHHIHDND
ncbi:erythropoietin receptor [Eucyclogobius newberryi]|uniref:erythropoietin receptor n=1 Tax=Eucyclogobius newberryi TaxID=166745 RepID=UPI003B5C6699